MSPTPNRILIVKLGAMGDVLRTTPLLTAYKRLYPTAHITWLVDESCQSVLHKNPLIDELLVYSKKTLNMLEGLKFDLVINLDKEPEALDSILHANAITKQGFGWSEDKKSMVSLNVASDYALRLGIDDELKFRQNKKTYQQIIYEQAELAYEKDEYVFVLEEAHRTFADKHLKQLGIIPDKSPLIGINTGSGEKFAGKKLPENHIVQLAKHLKGEMGCQVILLGGPDEHDRNMRIEAIANGSVINSGTNHSIFDFAGIVSNCDLVITGDTIAMHIAIATKTPLYVFFGSTCSEEIELYDRGQKLVSSIDCAPCYKRICPINDKCMNDLPLENFLKFASECINQNH